MFKIKNGDTRPIYIVALKDEVDTDDEGPLKLEDVEEVFFIMRKKDTSEAPAVRNEADIVDAPTGVVSYTWQPGDTDEVGVYDVEFELHYKDGGIETVPNDGYFAAEVTDDLDD